MFRKAKRTCCHASFPSLQNRYLPFNPKRCYQVKLFQIKQISNKFGRLTCERQECDFHGTSYYPGIQIVHIVIKREVHRPTCSCVEKSPFIPSAPTDSNFPKTGKKHIFCLTFLVCKTEDIVEPVQQIFARDLNLRHLARTLQKHGIALSYLGLLMILFDISFLCENCLSTQRKSRVHASRIRATRFTSSMLVMPCRNRCLLERLNLRAHK